MNDSAWTARRPLQPCGTSGVAQLVVAGCEPTAMNSSRSPELGGEVLLLGSHAGQLEDMSTGGGFSPGRGLKVLARPSAVCAKRGFSPPCWSGMHGGLVPLHVRPTFWM